MIKFKKMLCLIAVFSMISVFGLKAQTHWTCNPTDYQYDMSVYASVTIGDEKLSPADCELAAFVGDECRGVAEALDNVPGVFYLRVRSKVPSGEKVSFKAYVNGEEVESLLTTIDFASQEVKGTPSAPYGITDKAYTLGDVNGDGKITGFDASLAINEVLKVARPANFIFEAADMNGDGKVTGYDVSLIIDLILNKK